MYENSLFQSVESFTVDNLKRYLNYGNKYLTYGFLPIVACLHFDVKLNRYLTANMTNCQPIKFYLKCIESSAQARVVCSYYLYI